MYRTILLSAAKKDIHYAAKWYNEQQQGLGRRFFNEVGKKRQQIIQNPFAYAVRYKIYRTARLDFFPFMIHFTVDNDTVLISAVLHTSQNPSSWPNNDS